MPRTRLRTLASWAGAVALLALFATPAAAAIASVPVAIGPDGGVLVMADNVDPNLQNVLGRSILHRWGDATATLHNSGTFDIGAMLTALSRSTGTSWMMQGAATCWVLLQGLYDFAITVDPLKGFGAGLDTFVAGLSGLVFGPVGLIAVIFTLLAAVAAHVRSSRMGSAQGWKRLLGVVLMFGTIGIMGGNATFMPGVGAAASTGTGADYKPGMFSPGWAISTTNAGINQLSTTLSTVTKESFLSSGGDKEIQWMGTGGGVAAGSSMTCTQYEDTISNTAQRDADNASNPFEDAGAGINRTGEMAELNRSRTQLSFLLSDLWSQSGLEAYKNVQYGSNKYADKVHCRLLEQNAGKNEAAQLFMLGKSAEEAGAELARPEKAGDGMNVFMPDNSANRMATMTAWAACATDDWGKTWTVDPDWAASYVKKVNGKETRIEDGDCSNWWNGTGGTDNGDIPDIFDVDGTPSGVAEAVPGDNAASEPIRDYLLTLNGGWSGLGGSGSAFTYLLGSLATIIALGIVCVGTIIAKLLGIFYVLALMLMLMAGLFMRSGWSKVKQTTFQMIGSQIFAAAAVLILTFIVIFTQLLMAVGGTLFERGSIWALAWMGLAPAMALIGFNLIFKKIFRLPSPMSIKGGQLFANAAAAGGGGLAGSMLGSMGRGDGDPVEQGSRRLTRAAKEQMQRFGTPQDPNKREGAMGGGKRRTKLAGAAAGDANAAGAVAGGGAAAGAGAAGAATGAVGDAATGAGDAVTVPLGAQAAKGTVAEQIAALKHAKAEGRGGLAGATVLPAVAGAGLLGRGIGAAGKKAIAGHRNVRDAGGYKAAIGSTWSRGKERTLATAKNNAKQWRQARNAQGQMVAVRTTGVGAALERARESRFQSLAASRGINLATATRDELQKLRNDSTPARMVSSAARARGAKAIADSKALPGQMKAAAKAAPRKIATGAVKAYNDPKTMSRVKTAAKIGAGAAAIGLTGGLAAAPMAAYAAHKGIGKSRGYIAGTRKGEHQADRLQSYRDAHANAATEKQKEEAATAAEDKAATKARESEERIVDGVAAKFAAAEAEKQKQAEAKANAEANTTGSGSDEQQPSNPSDQTDYNREL